MIYPNSNKTYKKKISHANRGINLEEIINDANKYYLDNDIAIIYKKPTPIGVVEVSGDKSIITKAYFKEPSTLDYIGIFKGKYIEFDAKQTINQTSFPLSNIKESQIEHMRRIVDHGGITFLIIQINNDNYIYMGEDLLSFLDNNKRRSLPYNLIKNKGYLIKKGDNLIIIDYIKTLTSIIGGTYEKTKTTKT